MSTTTADNQETARALERASRIIEVVSSSAVPMTIAEIERATKLPKATAYRLTRQLVALALLQTEPGTKRHTEGPRLRALSWNSLNSVASRTVRRGVISALVEDIGETCYIGTLTDGAVHVLDSVQAPHALCINVSPGMQMPVHATSSGKLLLSEMAPRDRATMLEGRRFEGATSSAIVDPQHLEVAIAAIARAGFATENNEFADGVVGVAVPIRNVGGRILGSLALTTPAIRMSLEQATAKVPQLHDTAAQLARTFAAY